MANKNDPQPAAKEVPPVEKATIKTPAPDPDLMHNKLRADRRKIEAELAEVDDKLRAAISSGDLKALEDLTTRKAELPKLFIQASIAETEARRARFNAEDEINVKELRSAEDQRDKLRATILKRRQQFEAELAQLQEQLDEAEGRVGSTLQTLEAAHNLGAAHDAGFKKSLAKLAGV